MEEEKYTVSGATFLMVWVVLMALTVSLIALSFATFSGKEALMVVLMFAMAYLVSFYFMHLRFEKLPLILSVVLGIVATTVLLYLIIMWDGTRIARLTQ